MTTTIVRRTSAITALATIATGSMSAAAPIDAPASREATSIVRRQAGPDSGDTDTCPAASCRRAMSVARGPSTGSMAVPAQPGVRGTRLSTDRRGPTAKPGRAPQAAASRDIVKAGWSIVSAVQHSLAFVGGKPDFAGEASLAGVLKPPLPGEDAVLDDDPATVWTTPAPTSTRIMMLMIDMGKAEQIAGVSLTPTRKAVSDAGPPGRYSVETSKDGRTWRPAGKGAFGTIAAHATQRIVFAKPRDARYLMLGFTSVATAQPKMAIAGIGAFRP